MGIYAKIKELCDEKRLSIRKFETECGFSHGSVAKWDGHKPSYEKLKTAADYLGVAPEYLTGEAELFDGVASYVQQPWYTDPDAAELAQRLFDDPAYRVLFDAAADATPEDLQAAADILRRLKEARRK